METMDIRNIGRRFVRLIKGEYFEFGRENNQPVV